MPPLPGVCNPSILNSKEVGREKVLNIDQELIFKSVFNSPFNRNNMTSTKAYSFLKIPSVCVQEDKEISSNKRSKRKWPITPSLKWWPLNSDCSTPACTWNMSIEALKLPIAPVWTASLNYLSPKPQLISVISKLDFPLIREFCHKVANPSYQIVSLSV